MQSKCSLKGGVGPLNARNQIINDDRSEEDILAEYFDSDHVVASGDPGVSAPDAPSQVMKTIITEHDVRR